MNLNRYTEKAQEAILGAQSLAERATHPEITPEHLLLALVAQRDGIVPSIVGKMQLDPAALGAEAQALVDKLPKVRGGAQPNLEIAYKELKK